MTKAACWMPCSKKEAAEAVRAAKALLGVQVLSPTPSPGNAAQQRKSEGRPGSQTGLIGLDAELGCSSGEFELGVDVEFRVGVAQVCFDGAFAEEQVPGDVRR